MKDGRYIVRVSLDMLNVIIRRPGIVTVIYGYFNLPFLFPSILLRHFFPAPLLSSPPSNAFFPGPRFSEQVALRIRSAEAVSF